MYSKLQHPPLMENNIAKSYRSLIGIRPVIRIGSTLLVVMDWILRRGGRRCAIVSI